MVYTSLLKAFIESALDVGMCSLLDAIERSSGNKRIGKKNPIQEKLRLLPAGLQQQFLATTCKN